MFISPSTIRALVLQIADKHFGSQLRRSGLASIVMVAFLGDKHNIEY
jgi:hypothetical protein